MARDIFQSENGQTPITPEEQLQLLPSITTRAQLNEIERFNINSARIWAMRGATLRRNDLLTDAFARELHQRMFNRVWRWAGRYRMTERNLGWEAHRITEGVRNLFDDAQCWMQLATYPLHESAVRLHHRLVAIHPWPNGNGRHARLMADILVASRSGAPMSWGSHSELIEPGLARVQYIAALKAADAGDMTPLLEFSHN